VIGRPVYAYPGYGYGYGYPGGALHIYICFAALCLLQVLYASLTLPLF